MKQGPLPASFLCARQKMLYKSEYLYYTMIDYFYAKKD